jgi:hypothetical protein
MTAAERSRYHAARLHQICVQIRKHGPAPHRVRAWIFHQRRALGLTNGG